jgi:hypothetical protein
MILVEVARARQPDSTLLAHYDLRRACKSWWCEHRYAKEFLDRANVVNISQKVRDSNIHTLRFVSMT